MITAAAEGLLQQRHAVDAEAEGAVTTQQQLAAGGQPVVHQRHNLRKPRQAGQLRLRSDGVRVANGAVGPIVLPGAGLIIEGFPAAQSLGALIPLDQQLIIAAAELQLQGAVGQQGQPLLALGIEKARAHGQRQGHLAPATLGEMQAGTQPEAGDTAAPAGPQLPAPRLKTIKKLGGGAAAFETVSQLGAQGGRARQPGTQPVEHLGQ